MDGLSIAASITGIITAATQVGLWLSQIRDAPASVAAVASEIQHTKVVFRALQTFINRNKSGARQNSWIIQVDDITVILTQTVLVLSQLRLMFEPWSNDGQQINISTMDRVRWIRQEKAVGRLIDQLQRHKTSLTLLFQLIRMWVRVVPYHTYEELTMDPSLVRVKSKLYSMQPHYNNISKICSRRTMRLQQDSAACNHQLMPSSSTISKYLQRKSQ